MVSIRSIDASTLTAEQACRRFGEDGVVIKAGKKFGVSGTAKLAKEKPDENIGVRACDLPA